MSIALGFFLYFFIGLMSWLIWVFFRCRARYLKYKKPYTVRSLLLDAKRDDYAFFGDGFDKLELITVWGFLFVVLLWFIVLPIYGIKTLASVIGDLELPQASDTKPREKRKHKPVEEYGQVDDELDTERLQEAFNDAMRR